MSTRPIESRLALTLDLDAPGRHFGDLMLRWSDNSNPLGYHPVPMISIKGNDGPVLMIIGGTHGDEFEGSAAIMRLVQALKPENLNGQVIAIPALNAPAALVSSRTSPLDAQNLNRAFPGDPDGGPTAMLAHYVETVLMPRCDAVIDLHSGGKASFFQPCALATRTADSTLFARNLELAQAFGLRLIWQLGANNDNRSLNSAAERVGVPMIAAELGGGGGVDPGIADQTEAGLLNCLRSLEMLAGNAAPPETPRRVEIVSPHHALYAPADGLFDRAFSAGQQAQANQIAGHLHFIGEPERASRALAFPASGLILAHTCRGMVRRGEMLALVVNDVSKAP